MSQGVRYRGQGLTPPGRRAFGMEETATAGSLSVRILPRALHVVGLASLRTPNGPLTGRSSVDTSDQCLYNHFSLSLEAKPLKMNIFGARSLPTSPVCS